MTTNISAAMRAAVGTELSREQSYPVCESDIRRWALAVYWPSPAPRHFLDESGAASRATGFVAPEEFNPFAWAVAARHTTDSVEDGVDHDPDRLERMAGIHGPGLQFMLNGGVDVTYGVPIRPDDVITNVRRLGPYSERQGRLGLMLFSRTNDTWTNQRGEMVKDTISTLIRY